MARYYKDLEVNKNGVIFWYSCPYPSAGERPIGCCVQYLCYSISASVFNHRFAVFSNSENLHKEFNTLREAKNFVKERFNLKYNKFNF